MKRNNYTEIHDGFVRLYPDGRVEHWDGPLATWRPGWGPFGTVSALGEDWDRLCRWRETAREEV